MAVARERLYFNADKTKLLKEGDEDARILACAPGDEIPEVDKAVVKQVDAAANKQAAKAANKAK